MSSMHPGVDRANRFKEHGWEIRFAEHCEETEAPSHGTGTLRDLKARTAVAHGFPGDAA